MKLKRLEELASYCDNEAGNNKECADIYIDLYTLVQERYDSTVEREANLRLAESPGWHAPLAVAMGIVAVASLLGYVFYFARFLL